MLAKWLFRLIQGLLALAFLMSGATKLFSGEAQIREMYTDPLGYAPSFMYVIGALELIAALGLVAGFRWRRLAAASALGLAVILIGAIISHLAAGPASDAVLPAVYLVLLAALLYRLIGKEAALRPSRLPVGASR
jgi:DoxX.